MLCYTPLSVFVTKQPTGACVSQLRAPGATADWSGLGADWERAYGVGRPE